MPGIQDLLQLAQGSGAPSQPMGGGGAPGGGMAQALQSKLAELMQDPVAMKGMQQYMQQMGGGMGAPGSAQAPPTGGPMDMTAGIPPGGPPPGMEAPPGAPMDIPPGQEQDMVSQEIDRVGATWDGEDEPTANDIERLKADPSQTNIDSFNQQFGEGAAEEYVGSGEDSPAPPDEAEAAEY
jgi:hypothetical protein